MRPVATKIRRPHWSDAYSALVRPVCHISKIGLNFEVLCRCFMHQQIIRSTRLRDSNFKVVSRIIEHKSFSTSNGLILSKNMCYKG
jgi:hypothetical protein